MKTRVLMAALTALLLTVWVGVSQAASRRAQAKSTTHADLFASIDKDGNGTISRTEFQKYRKSLERQKLATTHRKKTPVKKGPESAKARKHRAVTAKRGRGPATRGQAQMGKRGRGWAPWKKQQVGKRGGKMTGQPKMRSSQRRARTWRPVPQARRPKELGRGETGVVRKSPKAPRADRPMRNRRTGWPGINFSERSRRVRKPESLASDRDVIENWRILADLGLVKDIGF